MTKAGRVTDYANGPRLVTMAGTSRTALAPGQDTENGGRGTLLVEAGARGECVRGREP